VTNSRLPSLLAVAAVVAAAATISAPALAAPITPGNLVVFRAGDGITALTGTAAPVFLDEYTTAGTLVQSFPVPTTGTTQQLTVVGNATTEGIISRSQDGTRLVFMGYRSGTGVIPTGAGNARVIGTLNVSGTLDTSIGVTDLGTATPRSATTVDGSAYWIGASTAVRYVGTPTTSSTSVAIDARNSRQVNLYDNVLYASNGSTAITGKVQSYGTLPTSTTAATPLLTYALSDAVNGFSVLDLDGVPGPDTIYALATTQTRLDKWSLVSGTWTLSGTTSSTGVNLAAVPMTGGTVALYVSTGSLLRSLTDTGGFGNPISGTFTTIVTAATNTAFRGVGVLVPEPSTCIMVLSGLAFGGWHQLRRRKGKVA
jgi:hypothetical protein